MNVLSKSCLSSDDGFLPVLAAAWRPPSSPLPPASSSAPPPAGPSGRPPRWPADRTPAALAPAAPWTAQRSEWSLETPSTAGKATRTQSGTRKLHERLLFKESPVKAAQTDLTRSAHLVGAVHLGLTQWVAALLLGLEGLFMDHCVGPGFEYRGLLLLFLLLFHLGGHIRAQC